MRINMTKKSKSKQLGQNTNPLKSSDFRKTSLESSLKGRGENNTSSILARKNDCGLKIATNEMKLECIQMLLYNDLTRYQVYVAFVFVSKMNISGVLN